MIESPSGMTRTAADGGLGGVRGESGGENGAGGDSTRGDEGAHGIAAIHAWPRVTSLQRVVAKSSVSHHHVQ
ncbi:MAG: hypothetical protein ABW022_10465, partial [Actinoplanes sp.]